MFIYFLCTLFICDTQAACYGTSLPAQAQRFSTTGNPMIDAAINTEASALAASFGVTPRIYTMNDMGAPNAISTCGAVSLGLTLLAQELWSMEKGPVAVAGVMAHEWAHELQCSRGSALSVTEKELQADYLAGVYLRSRGHLSFDTVAGFARSLYEKGDYNFWDPQHHGTPAQRVEAMQAGFMRGGSVLSAYEDSPPHEKPACTTRYTPCTHPSHSNGHVIICQHPTVITQPGPCRHMCYGPYGPMPCHAADPYNVTVPSHPDGDIIRCQHPAHSEGDPQQVCD